MEHYGKSSLCPLKYYIGGSLFYEYALEILKFGNSVFVCFFCLFVFSFAAAIIPFRRHSNCPVDSLNAQSVILAFDLHIPTHASIDICSHVHVDAE